MIRQRLLRSVAASAVFVLSLGVAHAADAPADPMSNLTVSTDVGPIAKDDEAIATLRNQLRADPKNYDASLKLGEIYLRQGKPAEAIKHFTAALPSSDHAARAQQGLGLSFLRLSDADSAKRYLTEALESDSKLWRAHLGLAQMADEARDWAVAEKAYQDAIAISPQTPAIYNNLGLSYMRQRRYDDAIAQFQKSLQLKGSLAVKANLRFAFAMKGDYLTALAGVAKDNLADTLNNVGYAAMLCGYYDAAEAYFSRAIEAQPSYHARAADNLRMVKDLRQAKKAAAKATPKPAHTAER